MLYNCLERLLCIVGSEGMMKGDVSFTIILRFRQLDSNSLKADFYKKEI